MWKPQLNGIDPIVGSAGAAVLCTVLAQHSTSRQSELCSEILCWMILPILFKTPKRSDISTIWRAKSPHKLGYKSASSPSLWIFAGTVVIASCYRAEIGMIGFLPALSPLLLIAETNLRGQWQDPRTFDPSAFSPLVNTVWGTTLAASFAILALLDWNLRGSVLSTIPVAALLLSYVALVPRAAESTRFLPMVNMEKTIIPISLRVVAILVLALFIQTVEFGLPSCKIKSTLSLGFAKALSWYFTTQTTCGTSWLIATAIATFSIMSTRDPFKHSSQAQSLSHVIASILALSQIIHLLPKQAKGKSTLWIFVLLSIVPYLANEYAIRVAQSSSPPSFGLSQEHPVEALIHIARTNFDGLLERQSQNYSAACKEYRRRYNVEPPPGFEDWYEFAVEHQSPIIDDFDIIFEKISPFWSLSGKEVIGRMRDVQNAPNTDLWACKFSGDRGKTRCNHASRTFDRNMGALFDKMIGDLRGVLPNLTFIVNHLDEPSVLIPPLSMRGDSYGKKGFRVTELSERPIWDAITTFCASQQSIRSDWAAHTVETFALPFVTDLSSATELCQHPEYSSMHGLVMSPTSFVLIEGLVPILSTGSLSTMGDLLFPSPAYIDSGFRYEAAHDIEWNMKQNKVYWAGSTTGGFAPDDKSWYYHRQRFVNLAQNLGRQQHYYLREKGGIVSRVKYSFLNSRLFDVAFAKIFQCEKKSCRDQRAHFNMKPWAHKDRALRSRLVFDIDGNGISGRYYKLLASKSVPLKQTLFREWHDERLMPWVHYIPVSQGMEEMPELVFYLTSTEAGQQRAKEIAEEGREWYSRAFRDIDLSIYTYRMMLELARLQDPKRKAS